MNSIVYNIFSLAVFLPNRILRVALTSDCILQKTTVIRLKSIRRALRPTPLKAALLSFALVSIALLQSPPKTTTLKKQPSKGVAIVSRIEKTVTLTAPLLKEAPLQAVAPRVTKGHKVAAVPKVTKPKAPNEPSSTQSPVVTVVSDEDGEGITGEDEEAIADRLLSEGFEDSVAVNLTPVSEEVAEQLLDESFPLADSSLPVGETTHEITTAPLVAVIPSEVTTVQMEGRIQPSNFRHLESKIAEIRGDWFKTRNEFQDSFKEEPQLVSVAPVVRHSGPQVTGLPSPIILHESGIELPLPKSESLARESSIELEEKEESPAEILASLGTQKLKEDKLPKAHEILASLGEVKAPINEAPSSVVLKEVAIEGPQLVQPSNKPKEIPEKKAHSSPVQFATMTIQPSLVTHPLSAFSARAVAPQTADAMIVSAKAIPVASKKVLDAKAEIAAITQSPIPTALIAERHSRGAEEILSDVPRARSSSREPELTHKEVPPVVLPADDEDVVDENAEGGKAFGRLYLEPGLASWLENKKGHVELYLHPLKGKNADDTIFLDYSYPDEEFEFSTEGLRGNYRLIAGFFTPGTAEAIAQVALPEVISASNYKQSIRFQLKLSDFKKAQKKLQLRAKGLAMTVTVFEGASGDYRHPKAIPKARMAIEGFPETGTFNSDSEGNIRLPVVPSNSTLKVHLTADGYFDTHVTIPTFSSPVYSSVFLVAREKVDAITKYFTKNPQQSSKGVVMGRVYDPKTRTPKAGEKVSLHFRKGNALYFNALPDPTLNETSNNGLFGYYNVISGFRPLRRESHETSFLFNVDRQSALYLEFGRGGEKALKGKLTAPSNGHVPMTQVRLVGGSPGTEVLSDSSGRFTLPGIDFPAGSLLMEVEAEGYPLFWYDIPWNPRQSESTRSFYMMDKEMISGSAESVAKIKWKAHLGAIIGGAKTDFFNGRKECVAITLDNLSGKKVSSEHGPYPLSGPAHAKGDKVCLTSDRPGFTFFNLAAGEYLLKWRNAKGAAIRSRVVHVGLGRVSIALD